MQIALASDVDEAEVYDLLCDKFDRECELYMCSRTSEPRRVSVHPDADGITVRRYEVDTDAPFTLHSTRDER